MIANALLCQGALDLAESPEQAIQSLDKACAFLDASDYRYLSEEAHLLARARAQEAGDIDGGEQDLRVALAELEHDRQSFGYSHSLVSFDGPEAVFEEMIDLQIKDRKRSDIAFHYADASRSSSASPTASGRPILRGSGRDPGQSPAEPPSRRHAHRVRSGGGSLIHLGHPAWNIQVYRTSAGKRSCGK